MNVYVLIPLVAVIAYVPLLITTVSSRPLRKQQKLFSLFLTAAILWSLSDLLLRADFLPQYNMLMGGLIMIMFHWMGVQLHCFASSFFAPGQGRWLPFAYASLAGVIAIAALGYLPEDIVASGSKHYPVYGKWVLFVFIPLLTLAVRDIYVFWKRLKVLANPVLYNQIVALTLTISVLIVFGVTALLPWGREYAIVHFGSIINAFILSYATVRHQLLDIRIVLRRGLAWVSTGVIGIASYLVLLFIFNTVLHFDLDMTAMLIATLIAVLVAIFIYRMHGYLFVTMGKVFQGQSYDYRQKLSDFAVKIHNVFSLREQGGELLKLVSKAIGCKRACLLFLEVGSDDFTTQFVEPRGKDNPLSGLRFRGNSPIVEYLGREQKLLTREHLDILPEFRSLWEQEKAEIKSTDIELLVPLISRDRLIGILALEKKQSGRYSLEDFHLIEEVTKRVAVSMEKEYLQDRLREREEELSVINRSSTIITSSMDIEGIYDSFIEELKKVVDVSWAAIVLIEENDIYFLALSSEVGSAWEAGERVPGKGSATEWVANHKKTVYEPDLSKESRFGTAEYHLKQGIRSLVYLPLIAKGKAIGSLIIASRQPNAYSQRHITLLEQLAYQIAMPVENSRLYAEAEEKARVDELTGLLNRRSLDEMIASEVGRHSRYGGVFSIIILDLDSFKAFNDNHGHLAGDRLLRHVGSVLKSTIRTADQAFRYGGDEFAVLLAHTTTDNAYEVAERIRSRLASEVEAEYAPVTASLGLASWPINGISANEVIAAADAALYHAKRSGGNQGYLASVTLPPLDDPVVGSGEVQESESLGTIMALAATVDSKDHYTGSHSKKVKEHAVALAEALNLEPLEISRLETCSLLHDIGKIGISDDILNKRGKLKAEEWATIKAHPETGATIASHARELVPYIAGILHHHERYDGSGYPKGLKGEEIPLEARILAIADAFAAMTSERAYSDALPWEEAVKEIKRGAGKQFDPHLVEVFLSVVSAAPVKTTGKNV